MTSIISRGLILLIVSGCTYPYPTKHTSQVRHHRTPASYAAHPPKPNWKCNPYDDRPCYKPAQPNVQSQLEGELAPTNPVTRRATVIVQELPTNAILSGRVP